MPTFYVVSVDYKDGTHKVFDGLLRDLPQLEAQLRTDPNVRSWTIDYES